ncbi:MAG: SBBP repeat-containing protein [Spirosomataceae bacterium]
MWRGIAIDGSGNVCDGLFRWYSYFGATSITSAGSFDIFVAKYNSGGTFRRVQQAGGTNSDVGGDIATDGSGNVYVAGFFNGTATFGATPITSAGGNDIFVTKYNSGGTFQWVQKGGGTSSDVGGDIATDSSGNIYVIGYFAGTATFGATSISSVGSFDIFVARVQE